MLSLRLRALRQRVIVLREGIAVARCRTGKNARRPSVILLVSYMPLDNRSRHPFGARIAEACLVLGN